MEKEEKNPLKRFEKSDIGKRIAKLSATATPPIAAALMFPAETYSFLKAAKDLGFEIPMIIFFATCIWWFRKDTTRIVDTRLTPLTESMIESARVSGEVSTAVKGLSEEVKKSTDEANKRYSEVNERFLANDDKFNTLNSNIKTIGEKVLTIETHLAGGVPPISANEIQELAHKVAAEAQQQISHTDPDLTP